MDRRIELVLAQIDADLAHTWETAELAELVNLSASRFRHLFKEETGVSLGSYLREQRLVRAEFLLRTTFLSIKEATTEVGVKSMGHFVLQFKARFGVTPSAYRKQLATFVKH
jgi:AraC family transcriptional regulator, arabinose operon regulatory protein